jgi:hypothetical protein
MRLLTLLLVLFTSQVLAQFNTIDGKTFRRLTDFSMPTRNFGVDTVKAISIIDTSRASGLLLLSKDTTAMYVDDDTMQMFTTAKAWNFTPSLPCCLPDTLDLNYINIVNCQPNRNEFLIARPNNTITTTECDTISYLYVDTIRYGVDMSGLYIPLAGTDSLKPVTGNIQINALDDIKLIYSGDLNGSYKKIYFDDDGQTFGLESKGAVDLSRIDIGFEFVRFSGDNESYRGITGFEYYGANYDSLTYVQKKYVDDNFTANSSILSDTATLDFASIPAQLFEDLTVTVTGASVGDVVSIGIPTAAAVPSSMFTAFVSATDTVTIRAANISLISIDPASGLFKVKVFKD